MTTVTVLSCPDGTLSGFAVKGHAGTAPKGEDLVCAALSALSFTAANALEALLGIEAEVTIRDGHFVLKLPQSMAQEQQKQAHLIIQTVLTGMRNLQHDHPLNVRVSG